MARQYRLQKPANPKRSGIDYKAELNPSQYAAVSAWPPGPSLVIAGAGSGKTRTLTYRVAWLLDKGVAPNAILLLTFTNKAAREMIERVEKLVPLDVSGLWSGTFHSVGNRLLRRHAEMVGWRQNFTIMDREDQKELLSGVLSAAGVDTKNGRFPKADVVSDMISYAANTGQALSDVVAQRYPYFSHLDAEIERVAGLYAEKKVASNCMDFDDLLVQSVRLLAENPELRENYRKRFQFVLVDEFQDTNTVQSELVDLLVGENRSLMVVGDDAQSIYSWRGANFENILSFPERYPGATVFTIETNYRSVPEILDVANASIAMNTRQFPKKLTAVRAEAGELPGLIPLNDPGQQAQFVTERIVELVADGVELNEIAVLYRAHFHSMDVQMALTAAEVPFTVTSGLRFFEQAHMKDVAAFLRIVVNPDDEVAFLRLARMVDGVGEKTARQMWIQWCRACGGKRPTSFGKILSEIKVPAKGRGELEQVGYTLDELVQDGVLVSSQDAITSVIDGIYDEWLKDKFPNYTSRRQDLEQFRAYAIGHPELESLLAELSLLSGIETPSQTKPGEEKATVTLSTIHQAKGLEWKAVFLIWLTASMFPNPKALGEDSGSGGKEEERRLFYVGLTRAKEHLHLCYPMLWPGSYSGDVMQSPSPFLAELPDALLEMWDIEEDTW